MFMLILLLSFKLKERKMIIETMIRNIHGKINLGIQVRGSLSLRQHSCASINLER